MDMEDDGHPTAVGSPRTPGKRRRSREHGGDELETQKNNVQVVDQTNEQQVKDGGDENELEDKAPAPSAADSARAKGCDRDVANESDEEEEMLVVLELCDFKNHPLFDDYSSGTLEGIDTATPTLKIGEYELHGQIEETVGTSYFYDTDTSSVPDKTYQFAGQTVKKIKFTIAPLEDV